MLARLGTGSTELQQSLPQLSRGPLGSAEYTIEAGDTMGIHQLKIDLVPRAFFLARGMATLPAQLDKNDLDKGGWWILNPPSKELIDSLRTLLPINKSWGETEEYHSTKEWTSSEIQIWKESDKVVSIVFKFSPMADDMNLLLRFLEIASKGNVVLVEAGSGNVVEPEESAAIDLLRNSTAVKFAIEPLKTVLNAAKRVKDGAA